MVRADEIAWTCDALAHVERADPLLFDELALLEYVTDLQEETRSLRRVLHIAFAFIAEQRDDLTRAARSLESLRREHRALREERAA
jgi:hypothetical protein